MLSPEATAAKFDARVRANQSRRAAELQSSYDFVICGAGSSGSVVARRLAENADASVLLLEAGGSDNVPSVMEAGRWPTNIGSERDWCFSALPTSRLNGRALPMSMGKVLGGGSSINVMVWSRGHKDDWDHFAAEAADPSWGYQSVLDIYRRIEDWRGVADPLRRGTGGLVYVQPAPDPSPVALAMLEGAHSVGIPTFDDQNGIMMEGDGGCAIANVRIRDGRRLSIFRTYTYPLMVQPNLTVLTGALVTRILLDHGRSTGVEFVLQGRSVRVGVRREAVLSLGAVNTPKVLMQSGIGDENHLRQVGIDVTQHLPGVGENFQDHLLVAGCIWEYQYPLEPRNNAAEATLFWKSDPSLRSPDLQPFQIEVPHTSDATSRHAPPAGSWTLAPGLVRPKSRGRVRLTGSGPLDPVTLDAGTFAEPEDLKALMTSVMMCREIGNSLPMRAFVKREVMPGDLRGEALAAFVRDATVTYWHQTCTAKMGRDRMAVVDNRLQVYGIEGLRVADGSIMPRITTGNTMAPCVVIGERAAEFLKAKHGL
ncbi:MAG TPA: GMC family oxidoreductase N-terminal domain-containing protein [Rhodopila sp.]